jgi:ATP-dependent Lon protease
VKRSTTAGLPETLPVMPLRSTIVFPSGVVAVQVGVPEVLDLLTAHPEPGLLVAAVVAPGGPDEPFDPRDLCKIAVLSRVSDRLNLPGETMQVTLQGVQRIRIRSVDQREGILVARVAAVREKPADDAASAQWIARILNALEALSGQVERVSREVPRILRMNLADPGRFVDLVVTLANFSVADKDRILQTPSILARLKFACNELESQLSRIRRLTTEDPAAAPVDASRRAAGLRQQIKLLQAQLGEVDPLEAEAVELLRRIDSAGLPALAAARARAEIERLRAGVPDAGEIRTYIDWLVAMPWRRSASEGPSKFDLDAVQRVMDRELLGLTEAKERLIDHLAVARLRRSLAGPIPCVVGPAGVGKASLVAALARGLGRPLVRLNHAGRSAADLLGVRRTRSDAQPGVIAALLREAKVNDPVILLDELDDGSASDVDAADIIREILAPAERSFADRYLDTTFDLSQALFIATAQDFQKIPRSISELMIEVRIAGYTPEEKVDIARTRLLPRLITEHGLRPAHVSFPDESLKALAHGYARDAGLGAFQRSLITMLRARARARAHGDGSRWTFDAARIEDMLGVPRYVATAAESAPEIGVVTGLAWTASGGELMFIEALRMPGTGRLIITGMLGDAMRESVNAAYSYVRSRGPQLGIGEDDFRQSDVHVHFPVGAIPKDGPSAGISVTLAIASTLSNRPVRHDVAMTGEVTLRGKVLEVGGIKEKVLAAHRADIRRVILPAGNEKDVREVPEKVRSGIAFHFVERMDDVVNLALVGGHGPGAIRLRGEAGREPRVAQQGKRKPKS